MAKIHRPLMFLWKAQAIYAIQWLEFYEVSGNNILANANTFNVSVLSEKKTEF